MGSYGGQDREQAGGKRRGGAAQEIGTLLASFLAGTTIGRSAAAHALEDAWARAVGPEIAEDTRITGYRQGTVRVEVRSSALLQELATYHRASILEALRAEAPKQDLREIEFRLGMFGPT